MKTSDLFITHSLITSVSSVVESTHYTSTAAAAKTSRLSTSFPIAEESLRRLWAFTDDGASESSASAGIHVVGLSLGGEEGSNNSSSSFKTFFCQKCDPKESTIAAFITIYIATMLQDTD